MIFSSLGLAPEIQKALKACRYNEMTPIQEQAIVPARRGKDVLATAQTGTGKTAAYTVPILQQMHDNPQPTLDGKTRALILAPTRELAEQLAETIKRYAQFMPVSVIALYGGVKMSSQKKKLKNNINIVVSTPGRLLEHVTEGNINLGTVEFVVIDEADRMLDMGFIDDVQTLLQKIQKKHQTLLFSATMSQAINQLANKLLKSHETIKDTKQNSVAETVEHVLYAVGEHQKADLFIELLDKHNWYKVLVFTSTKRQADELMAKLKKASVPAALIHGDKSQGVRRRAMAGFKSDKIQVLISTEIAARGLDIHNLNHVVNYNLPYLAEDYVHRVGRTGRAGKKGQAISLVSREEERTLDNIERLIGTRIKRIKMPGYEASSRDAIFENLARTSRPPRTNKASQVKNSPNKTGRAKLSKKKKTK
ncbi:MAG: DEAD/DEAH box helicase [Gammaproteobacteria bacterium]|nr:DEAD/DEAH box helicase [Gammaproteobacteria bacterium]